MDYKEELRKKLPELKKIEGFPIGEDSEIINLSKPPFYTVCPNPFIEDFVAKNGKVYDATNDNYHKEPFQEDIIEGKNDDYYLAHTYHTKVPPSAIVKYIEHFTNEGDIVADLFSGSGMTGVAVQLANRKAIISDLAPIASMIGFNFNSSIKEVEVYETLHQFINEVEKEFKEFYTTEHQGQPAKINYVVWSEVLISPFSKEEIIYYDVAYDSINGGIKETFNCPTTGAELKKSDCEKAYFTRFDKVIGQEVRQQKLVPVLINYTFKKKSYSKKPDSNDLGKISNIENQDIPFWFPSYPIPKGEKTGEPIRAGFTHIHHLYFQRTLWSLSAILSKIDIKSTNDIHKLVLLTSSVNRNLFKGNRFIINKHNPHGRINGPLSGTLFIPPLIVEQNPFVFLKYKLKTLAKMFRPKGNLGDVIISTQSSTDCRNIPDNSVDYVFTDPPFGANIMYSELNFIWESWLKVFTNNTDEAIINKHQGKNLDSYYELMLRTFKTYYRILKPKRWITVEFHNSKSSVWNKIQEGLTHAGFVVSSVKILDKKKGTINQSYIHGTVKSDLVISAYKPSEGFSRKFISELGKGLEVEFVREFLNMQPSRPTIERTDKMLYSKMLAFYIQHGYEINYDAKSFYSLLHSSFIEEDGFWFTSDQINSYIEYKKYVKLNEIEEIKSGGLFLFVTDEKSALVWLHNFLNQPKSFSDVSVAFNQLANIQDDQVPELRNLLEENFVFEGGLYRRPKSEEEHNQITEKRQKQLLKQFESILIQAQTERKKIKEVRKEALTYGFERCYKDKRFKDILTIASKLHPSILENNGELADFVEAAEIQTEGLT